MMAEERSNNQPEHPDAESNSIFGEDMPVEQEAPDVEDDHPRRAASAEFIVKGEAGSASVLREAMDPANQSLADALRLSYRVLQLVIVILIVLFLVSGFRNIENTETGVKTRWGNIVGEEQAAAELQPGLAASLLPYPAVEFIVFDRAHAVSIMESFWPNSQIAGRGGTYEQAAATVQPHDRFNPGLGAGRDGLVLLTDGIGHMQLQAQFEITDPVDFVNALTSAAHGRHVVELALQRAVVQTSAAMLLQQAIESPETVAERVQMKAQEMLDELDVGIDIQRVAVINMRPPVAVFSSMNQLGDATTDADSRRAEARSQRNRLLNQAAGPGHRELLELIQQYEEVILGEGTDSPEAESLLLAIDLLMESDAVSGNVSQTLAEARAYKESIISTLGAYADRFEALYPRYQANPQFVVRQQMIDVYSDLMAGELVEVIHLPANLGGGTIRGATNRQIMVERRRAAQQRREQQSLRESGLGRHRLELGEHNIRHRLELDEQGNVTGRANQ